MSKILIEAAKELSGTQSCRDAYLDKEKRAKGDYTQENR